MPSPETLARHAEAAKPRPEDKGEIGYRLVNPEDPPEEQFLVPLDPIAQAHAEAFFWRARERYLKKAQENAPTQ